MTVKSTSNNTKLRNVGFMFLGIAVLLFKGHYAGPLDEAVHSYAGNVAVSFAVYFLALHVPVYPKFRRLVSAGLAITAVTLFELFDGFGVLSNVYDPMDFVANAGGVFLALAIDTALAFCRRATANV
jgi:hypothetical protein